jgi:hypothetical protein
MPRPVIPDGEFVQLFESKGPEHIAREFRMNLRGVYYRRQNLEKKIGKQITAPDGHTKNPTRFRVSHPQRVEFSVINGVVIVGSDAHIWPGPVTPAMRAFIKFCAEMKPKAVILNGDVLDFSTISRYPPIGWEGRPTVQQEVESAQTVLHDIERAVPRGCKRIWTLGNHDSRFETKIATVAPEFAKVSGVHLTDHFPLWEPCWSAWINDGVVVKHRFKGGIHATHNNVMWSGKTTITGHLHSLKITPFTDYNGTIFGVDTGCLADVEAKQFIDYTEDGPKNWRSGFVVLTFRDGRLMWPEVVSVLDGSVNAQ